MFTKNYKSFIVRIGVALMLIVGVLGVMPVQASATTLGKTNQESSFLNQDGTLKLDGSVSGSIDLQGWDVELDSLRGPVFTPSMSSSLAQGWSDLGPWGPHDAVRAVAVSGSDVYVGGYFTWAGGTGTGNYIAKWDGKNWSSLGSNGAGGSSLNGWVSSIVINGTDVYVGGAFDNVNNNGVILSNADCIAKWDGTNWSALGSNGSGNGSLNGSVSTLTMSVGNLYVGGVFTDVNDNGTVLNSADYIAKWDGANWSALGSNGSGDGSLNNVPRALAVNGSDLYVGGQFTNVNNNGVVLNNADYIAKWNGTNWSALGSNGSGNGALSDSISASVWRSLCRGTTCM